MRVYQVYDQLDPPATDTYCRSQAEAKKAAAGMADPVIQEHDIVTSKAGLIVALTKIPKRADG